MTTQSRAPLPLSSREQYRIRRLQVYNWGTFHGLHDIPIPERGFLFVGRSGTGKSTLLDAFTALLVPPRWAEFNAAARDTERNTRDRNYVTYIRGAWAEQKDDESGAIAKQYLRTGTTWSALALTYRNGLGHTVVLVHLLWLRGSACSAADVRHHYLIFERPFDLREIADFDLDIRKLKHRLPEVFERGEFRPYCERFRGLLGIEDELTLRLLHKTQSAKNLGDLNTFLRDFMLEKPETFDVADRLVTEFAELNAAHQSVVIAREQVQTLQPARAEYERVQSLDKERNDLNELRIGVDSYREKRRMALLETRIAELEIRNKGLDNEIRQRDEILTNARSTLRDLELQHRAMGGDRIEQLETELQSLQTQRADRLNKRSLAQEACRKLARALPDSPRGFAELVGDARREIEEWQRQPEDADDPLLQLDRDKTRVSGELAGIERELAAMRRQPSNIPANLLDLREGIAHALRLPESALPFAGELIEVQAAEAPWRGAIERVLRGFALSLVVEDRHYASLAQHVNATHLNGQRLVYHRMIEHEAMPARSPGPGSLVGKLTLKDGDHAQWLRHELRQRFDYLCADSLTAFRNADRAVTREGQVKHGTSRHEKDDRGRVDDRGRWVLGFDNREKRALYEEQARKLRETLAALNTMIDALRQETQRRAVAVLEWKTLSNLQWSEIDVVPVLDRINEVERQLLEAREGNPALQEMNRRIASQLTVVQAAETSVSMARSEAQALKNEMADYSGKLEALRQNPTLVALTPHQQAGLTERYTVLSEPPTLENLDDLSRKVERGVRDRLEAAAKERADLEKSIESRFAMFKNTWKMDAGDLDATLASAPDFLAKLKRLETDNLPAYEKRFFELLQTQSHQNLAALSQHLRLARNTILDRLALVNESLGRAEFNAGTYLRIDASDRQLDEVREFKQDLEAALDHAWAQEPERMEERFLILRKLVERLGSQDPEQRRWREAVLDVRLHVEFIGRELDTKGEQVEIYRSGAGKSGGQRQKLATTCLAAALRYQLGGDDSGLPTYAPVVLDEAFDRADNEFTTLAMNIFANFGFQMIVATPLKSVMTLEPFIGGACFVDITDRRHSGVLLIEYDIESQRLKLPDNARDHADAAVS